MNMIKRFLPSLILFGVYHVCVAQSQVTSYLTGDAADVQAVTTGGIMLMGGSTDVDAALRWMISKCGGGDVVVIRSSGADGYNSYMYSLGKVNSVETLILDSREKSYDSFAVARIRNAEMLFIAGGDQWNYVKYWKDSPVEDAINYLLNTKKVPVGGTSAGTAILGRIYFAAQNGSVTSEQALHDPYHPNVTIQRDSFLLAPFLANTITDQHYTQRNRQGRLVTWLARMNSDWSLPVVKGIGVDEKTAVCIEPDGKATVYGTNKAFFIRNRRKGPEECKAGIPLSWKRKRKALEVHTIQGSSSGEKHFNIVNWKPLKGAVRSYYSVQRGKLQAD